MELKVHYNLFKRQAAAGTKWFLQRVVFDLRTPCLHAGEVVSTRSENAIYYTLAKQQS